LVASAARAGSLALWPIPVSGGSPEALTTGAGQDLDPEVSSDGRRLLFTNVKRIWSPGVNAPTTGSRRALDPEVSSDGRGLLFTNVKRIWSLVVHDTHTGSRRTLLETRTSLQ